jgi:DNA-directed RNA polymerase specialized sigma24 family protein
MITDATAVPVATVRHINPVLQWITDNHADMIKGVARKEHRGVQTVDVDDVEQAILQKFAEKARNNSSHKGTDFTKWDRAGLDALATKFARQYVARERIEYMHFAGAFIYNPAIVEVYLRDAVWANVEDVPDIDGRVDVRDAVNTLPLETRRCLFTHYGLDQPYKGGTKEYMTVYRAVERISDLLNMGSGVKIGDLADAA